MIVSVNTHPPGGISYYHLLPNRHEIIQAEGMWVESLFPGDTGLQAFEGDKKWIVQDGFDIMTARHATTARLILRGYEAGVLLNAIPAPRPVLPPQP